MIKDVKNSNKNNNNINNSKTTDLQSSNKRKDRRSSVLSGSKASQKPLLNRAIGSDRGKDVEAFKEDLCKTIDSLFICKKLKFTAKEAISYLDNKCFENNYEYYKLVVSKYLEFFDSSVNIDDLQCVLYNSEDLKVFVDNKKLFNDLLSIGKSKFSISPYSIEETGFIKLTVNQINENEQLDLSLFKGKLDIGVLKGELKLGKDINVLNVNELYTNKVNFSGLDKKAVVRINELCCVLKLEGEFSSLNVCYVDSNLDLTDYEGAFSYEYLCNSQVRLGENVTIQEITCSVNIDCQLDFTQSKQEEISFAKNFSRYKNIKLGKNQKKIDVFYLVSKFNLSPYVDSFYAYMVHEKGELIASRSTSKISLRQVHTACIEKIDLSNVAENLTVNIGNILSFTFDSYKQLVPKGTKIKLNKFPVDKKYTLNIESIASSVEYCFQNLNKCNLCIGNIASETSVVFAGKLDKSAKLKINCCSGEVTFEEGMTIPSLSIERLENQVIFKKNVTVSSLSIYQLGSDSEDCMYDFSTVDIGDLKISRVYPCTIKVKKSTNFTYEKYRTKNILEIEDKGEYKIYKFTKIKKEGRK